MKTSRKTKTANAGSLHQPCSAAILDYPNEAGWWWAWAENAKRWYLIRISSEDLDNDPELDNVPNGYAWWTKCVPPLPPNDKQSDREK
jgi:hypothetical protein